MSINIKTNTTEVRTEIKEEDLPCLVINNDGGVHYLVVAGAEHVSYLLLGNHTVYTADFDYMIDGLTLASPGTTFTITQE